MFADPFTYLRIPTRNPTYGRGERSEKPLMGLAHAPPPMYTPMPPPHLCAHIDLDHSLLPLLDFLRLDHALLHA
jgi:hypothetical protein